MISTSCDIWGVGLISTQRLFRKKREDWVAKVMSLCLCFKEEMCPLLHVFCRCEHSTWGFWNNPESLAAMANAEGWIKVSPSRVIIWLSVNGRGSCPLAEVTFSSYHLGVTNKGLRSPFFSASLLPLSYCVWRFLTNSHVLSNYFPVTTVSGLKKE